MDLPSYNEIQNQFLLHANGNHVPIVKLQALLKSLKMSFNSEQLKQIYDEIELDHTNSFTLDAFMNISFFNNDNDEFSLEDVMRSF